MPSIDLGNVPENGKVGDSSGMGFAQALSNVDRRRIQKRDDVKRYAIGVLALGSLLLTQLRHEHQEILNED